MTTVTPTPPSAPAPSPPETAPPAGSTRGASEPVQPGHDLGPNTMAKVLQGMRDKCGDFVVVNAPNQTALLYRGGGGFVFSTRDPTDPTKPGPDGQAVIDLARQLGGKVITDGKPIPTGTDTMAAHELIATEDKAEQAYQGYRGQIPATCTSPHAALEPPKGGVRTRQA